MYDFRIDTIIVKSIQVYRIEYVKQILPEMHTKDKRNIFNMNTI